MRDVDYQPYFCEENIWHLAGREELEDVETRVVVLSNAQSGFAMWNQRAADDEDRAVVWDYHVVLLGRGESTWCVFDLDSRRDTPERFSEWWQACFPYGREVPHRFCPVFRVLPGGRYREVLSSDRSHMKDDESDEWLHPPPSWPRIYQPSRGMNLDRFIDMDDDFVGEVLSMPRFKERFKHKDAEGQTSSEPAE